MTKGKQKVHGSTEDQDSMRMVKVPTLPTPALLTILAQKSGFFWIAQGLSAMPL